MNLPNLQDAIIRALSNANTAPSEVNFVLSGDLLNQCMGSSFALKDLMMPSIGLYGACSTMALSLSIGAMLVDGDAQCIAAGTSSHFCSSERQFRFPLEYGGQRPPTAQWTKTRAAASKFRLCQSARSAISASRTRTIWAPPWRRLRKRRSMIFCAIRILRRRIMI